MKKNPAVSLEIFERLRKYDTPTICNIIELFDIRPRSQGFMNARIQACFPQLPPAVGVAATATFRSASPPLGGSIYASLQDQVAHFAGLSGPPIIVFQDLDSPIIAATFGEIMCTTYQTFGAAGLITSGAGRDLEQVAGLKFPVFTGGTICAHGYCHIPDIHVPVHVGGITIYPDDLLHGDRNGVTTIPREIAADVADAGDEFAAAEAVILDALHSTGASLSHYQAAQAEAGEMIARLKARIGSHQSTPRLH